MFCLGVTPKTMELGWEASLKMGGCSILLDGIPSSSSRCPQKMEDVQLHDDGIFFNFFYTFN